MTQMNLLDLLPDVDDRPVEEQHFDYAVSQFFGPHSHRLLRLLNAKGNRKAQRALAAEAADGLQGGAGGGRRYASSRKGVTVHDYATGTDYSWTWLQIIDAALACIDAEREQEIRAEHAAQLARAAAARAEVERLARWWPDGTEVIWTAPWDTSSGMKAGDTCPGWRCWYCNDVTPNQGLLHQNHAPTSAWALEHGRCCAQMYSDLADRHDAEQATTTKEPTR